MTGELRLPPRDAAIIAAIAILIVFLVSGV